MTEWQQQRMLFQWAEFMSRMMPALKLLFHIPNGGNRNIVTAKRLKDTGVKRGVPDVFLAYPHKGYAGLFIEMKADKGKPTPDQLAWSRALMEVGYKVCLCHGFEEARVELLRYLGEPL